MTTLDAPKAESSLSFTQGLLLGQLSVVILIGAFIKFFIFGDPPAPDTTAALRATERRSRTLAHKRSLLSLRNTSSRSSPHLNQHQPLNRKRSSVLRNPPPLTTNTILSKTYYNMDAHQPESLDWFNVLVAQTIAQFRSDAQHDDAILMSLTKALNGTSRPDFLDEIKVTELSLGEDFPIFSNCRVIPVDEDGLSLGLGERGGKREHERLQARMDVDLSDFITLAVETKLLLNYPKPLAAVLPVALAVSVVRFSGTLSISFIPGSPTDATMLAFSFLDDYRLDFSVRSLVGSRSRLQDVPKIASLVEARLHTWFDKRAVEPRFQQIELPSLWPRKKNTKGGEEAQGAGSAMGSKPASVSRTKGNEIQRDLREEARREVEAEEEARRGDEGGLEGLRWRRKARGEDYAMPGSMPGLSVT
ncbi:hypothetical protein PZA11_006330 [Diplocarpon coronariae]|uniref:Maintenance of mitochondrial morphology protein 1 n=1 Tax=Diplocarpon coronariae TaxID=2795749 RepID=A0A218YYG3_9HELO|nr:hypothetical protein JHW43_005773 [Diplocarpon mali]OWP00016.1 hypothetical protein B2J93_2363 [Marssonina coronariae]